MEKASPEPWSYPLRILDRFRCRDGRSRGSESDRAVLYRQPGQFRRRLLHDPATEATPRSPGGQVI